MKLSLPKLRQSRFAQVIFVLREVIGLSWQVKPGLLILTFAINTFSGLLIYPTLRLEKAFIDGLVSNIGKDFWGPVGRVLIIILFLRFTINIVQSTISRIGFFLQRTMSRYFQGHLAMLMAKKNSELDIATLEDSEFRDRYSKIERESSRRAWGMMMPLSNLPTVLAGLVSTMAIIFSFQPWVSLVILLLSLPVFFVDSRFIKKEYQVETQNSPLYRIWGWLEYYLVRPRNFLEVKLLNLNEPFSRRIKDLQTKIYDERAKIEKKKTIFQILAATPQHFFNFLIGVYLALLVLVADLSVGSAEMILRAIGTFRDNLSSLVSNFLELYENYLYVADFVWLLNLKPSLLAESGQQKVPTTLKSGIEFKNVWFKYKDKNPWVLKDINLKISPKEKVAIVGENGAGKSTLVKLICRFYDPQRGQVLLDSIDLKQYSQKDLWQHLSALFQEFETYPFTARESIGYGDIAKVNDLDLIKQAARCSEAAEFIESLPQKYENPLDPAFEKGIRPSIGQWQRVALGRVFLKKARIVILDEPTSNVDPKAEEQIFQKIIQHCRKEILILISHRFSTVRRADRIHVLEKGRIIESGTHEELVKMRGQYAKLFELQAAGYR